MDSNWGEEYEMAESKSKKKDSPLSIRETGRIGRDVLNDLVQSITYLEPHKGSIIVEVDISVEDKNLFKDDVIRNGKLRVQLDLREPENI